MGRCGYDDNRHCGRASGIVMAPISVCDITPVGSRPVLARRYDLPDLASSHHGLWRSLPTVGTGSIGGRRFVRRLVRPKTRRPRPSRFSGRRRRLVRGRSRPDVRRDGPTLPGRRRPAPAVRQRTRHGRPRTGRVRGLDEPGPGPGDDRDSAGRFGAQGRVLDR